MDEIDTTYTWNQAQSSLFAKLARAMGHLSRIPKNGFNSHFGYAFATDADVSDAVRAALAAEGVAFFAEMTAFEQKEQVDAKGNIQQQTVAHFTYTFADSESGATWSCSWVGESLDRQDKGIAKAATASLKYFLLKNFILSTGDLVDDSDAVAELPRAKPAEPPTPPSEADPVTNRQTQAEWYAMVLRAIPYYRHAAHVKATLKLLGYTGWSAAKSPEMLENLNAHAAARANKETESESG